MTQYRYTCPKGYKGYKGPVSGVTLKDGTEVMLYDGATVDLPETNRWVRAMVARGHLVAVEEPQRATGTPRTIVKQTKEDENAS